MSRGAGGGPLLESHASAPRRRPFGSSLILLVACVSLVVPMLVFARWRVASPRSMEVPESRTAKRLRMRRDFGHAVSSIKEHNVDKPDRPIFRSADPETEAEAGTVQARLAEQNRWPPITETPPAQPTLSLANLTMTPRADVHCKSQTRVSMSDAEHEEALFKCRMEAAQALAEKACAELDANPPEPPFRAANLNIALYVGGIPDFDNTTSSETYQPFIRMAVEPHSDFVSQGVMAQGMWEASEVRNVIQALQKSNPPPPPPFAGSPLPTALDGGSHSGGDSSVGDPAVLLDIGANIGIFSFVAAVLGYTVHAFEAMPRNVQALHRTLCWNPELRKRVTVFPYGLAEKEEACVIASDDINVADGHVVCNEEQVAAYEGEMKNRGTTHTVRLEEHLRGAHVDVVKIDVEGYEPHVLAGAGAALDAVKYVMTEVNVADLEKKNNATFEEIGTEYLRGWEDRGFGIHICSPIVGCWDTPKVTAVDAVPEIRHSGMANALLISEHVAQ